MRFLFDFLKRNLVVVLIRLRFFFKLVMEEVVVAVIVSEITKCCFVELWKCCLVKCMRGDFDEVDVDYYVEDNLV